MKKSKIGFVEKFFISEVIFIGIFLTMYFGYLLFNAI